MKKLNIVLSIAAGLLGGVISHYALLAPAVQAQSEIRPPQEIRAQSFTLMNKNGEVGGRFSFDAQGRPVIRLFHEGRETWRAGGNLIRPLSKSLVNPPAQP